MVYNRPLVGKSRREQRVARSHAHDLPTVMAGVRNGGVTYNETITPERAKELLAIPGPGRKIGVNLVNAYVRTMQNGEWMNGIGDIHIRNFGPHIGSLANGRHRLTAAVRANFTLRTNVSYCQSEEEVRAIDNGKSRSFAEALQFDGVATKESQIIASVIQKYCVISGYASASKLTHSELKAIYDKHPNIVNSMRRFEEIRRKQSKTPLSIVIAMHYIICYILHEPVKADEMVNALVNGRSELHNYADYDHDPMYCVWSLMKDLDPKLRAKNANHVIWTIIQAWNKFIAGSNGRHMASFPGFVERPYIENLAIDYVVTGPPPQKRVINEHLNKKRILEHTHELETNALEFTDA